MKATFKITTLNKNNKKQHQKKTSVTYPPHQYFFLTKIKIEEHWTKLLFTATKHLLVLHPLPHTHSWKINLETEKKTYGKNRMFQQMG